MHILMILKKGIFYNGFKKSYKKILKSYNRKPFSDANKIFKSSMAPSGSALDSPALMNDNTKYKDVTNMRAIRPVSSQTMKLI